MPEPLGAIPSSHHWSSHCLLRGFPQGSSWPNTDFAGLRGTLLSHSSTYHLESCFGVWSPLHRTPNSRDYQENRHPASSTIQSWIHRAALCRGCLPFHVYHVEFVFWPLVVSLRDQIFLFPSLINDIILVSSRVHSRVQMHFTGPPIRTRRHIPTPSLLCFVSLTRFLEHASLKPLWKISS